MTDTVMSYPLTDKILTQYREVIGRDFTGYRHHVTRMLNFCHYLGGGLTEEESLKCQIAAAFHDIALWTHDRVDYLEPSVMECHQYLETTDYSDWQNEISLMIEMHHLVSAYEGPYEDLVELFRKADLVDFSLGIVKFGIPASFIKAVKTALPNAGFHLALMRFTGKQLTRNPFNPLPMMRYRNKYRNVNNP